LWQKLKTSLRRKESVGIPNIHKIAPEDHIKPVDYFQGFYPLNSWPPSNLDFTFASSQSKSKNPSRSPRAKTRDFEMAPRKNKSKVEEGTVANMSTGWRKSKMSESLVRELENMGLLQEQGISQWCAGEGEDYPMEGTLETVMFRDFVERGLTLPVSEFFYRLLQFWRDQLHHLTPQSILHLSNFTHFCEAFLGLLPPFPSSSLFQSLMLPIPPSSGDVNWYSALRTEASTWLMIWWIKELNGRNSGSMFRTLNPHFQKGLLVPPKSRRAGRVEDLVASKLKPFFVRLPLLRKKESLEIMWSSRLSVAGRSLSSCESILALDMKVRRIPLGCLQNHWLSLK